MRSLWRGAVLAPVVPAALIVLAGCGGGVDEMTAIGGPGGAQSAPPGPGGPGPGQPGGPGPSKIRTAMMRLGGRSPDALTAALGRELNEAQPPWETIQTQSKEYAQLAAELGQYAPPRGTKESWAEQTAAFAQTASDLDKAAQAKDKSGALAAHKQLTESCNACHGEHRRMGRGGPGRGGPGRGGPPGGPPPSGPPMPQ